MTPDNIPSVANNNEDHSSEEANVVGIPSDRQALLDKLTDERNRVLDRWADGDTLGLSQEERDINSFQRKHLKFLFGETGFNPPAVARNPVSVTMHNPRFSAALWAVNTEAYRRKGTVREEAVFLT